MIGGRGMPPTFFGCDRIRELVSRCPRGPRSGADVGREVLAGEGGAGDDEVGGCALEDDPAAVVAGAGAEVDDPVACAMTAWWCSMSMTDLPESTTRSSRPSNCSTSARWRPVA